ncbi:MAG TPA: clostripain-related cysteine peptidase [Vicinamibacterales bacterium]|nr:clostripain-related cysteine peptidase [Vicinamibacterales bacterium]
MPPDITTESAYPNAKWTVMVFMGAATIDGNAPLLEAAEADLAEMRLVGSGPVDPGFGRKGDELNIFVQVHQGGDTVPRRGRITEGMTSGINGLKPVEKGQDDLDGGAALGHFIRTSLNDAHHDAENPEHHSLLVLWGHAYDFAIGRTPTTDGTIDALDFTELTRVLERLQLQFGADAKLDILGFDACDLTTVEMACQLEPFAKYLLGSQIGIPLPGWPYDRILDRLRRPYGRLMGATEFGSYIVRRFCESYGAESGTASLTLLDLNRAEELKATADVLAETLTEAIRDPGVRDQICALFNMSQTARGKPFVDVADLCLGLMRNSDDAMVIEAARALGNLLISPRLISPRPPEVGSSALGYGPPLVVEHGRNTAQTARLNGISIYAPNVAPERDFVAVRHLYNNFVFAEKTHWSNLVHELARYS